MPPKRGIKSPSGRSVVGSPKLEVPLLFGNTKPVQYTKSKSPKSDQKASPKVCSKAAQSAQPQKSGEKRKTRSRRDKEEEDDEDNDDDEEEIVEVVTKKSRSSPEIMSPPSRGIKKGQPAVPVLFGRPNPVVEQTIKGPFSRIDSPQPSAAAAHRRECSSAQTSASKSRIPPQLYAGLTPSASRSPAVVPTPKILTGPFSQVQEVPRRESILSPPITSFLGRSKSKEKVLPSAIVTTPSDGKEIIDLAATSDTSTLSIAALKEQFDAFIISYGDYAVVGAVVILGVSAMMVNSFSTSSDARTSLPPRASSRNESPPLLSFKLLLSLIAMTLTAGYLRRSFFSEEKLTASLVSQSLVRMTVTLLSLIVRLATALYEFIKEVTSKTVSSQASRPASPHPVVGVKRFPSSPMLFGAAAGGAQAITLPQRTGVRFAENVGYCSSSSQSSESRRPGTPYSKPRSASIQPTKSWIMETMAGVYTTLGAAHSFLLVADVFLVLVFLFLRLIRYPSYYQYSALLVTIVLHPSIAAYLYRRRTNLRRSALVECISEVCKGILRINIGKPYAAENLKMHLIDKIKSKEWQATYNSYEAETGDVVNMSKVIKSEFLSVWDQVVDAIASDSRYLENAMTIDGSTQRCLVAKPSAKLHAAPVVPVQRNSYSFSRSTG